ncbi:alpha/beta fold hydrolase [Parvularcula lutaonensis]|uniref:Alpha/beta fold hydrolase n=1 Tax=Parvularcula lutaonensis TaxID=491923 RepID=A0ABV7MB90_9PROT|nr:alpha/beta hydrolase [Parvularcula lutaonensis]
MNTQRQKTPALRRFLVGAATVAVIVGAPFAFASEPQAVTATKVVAPHGLVSHRTIDIDGVEVFYREAGDPSKPTVLLLHGFPTSSQMFRNLIPELSGDFHVIAPDYPGYGASEQPARDQFAYTFANYAEVIEDFIDAKGVEDFSVYLMDYGAPVGFRLFAKNPERVQAFIIQNGNAYQEGLKEFWDPIKAYWKTGADQERDALRPFLEVAATEWQYTHGQPDPELISPDTWHTDQFLLDRPGNKDIQLDLFYDYRTNVEQYPQWQELFRAFQPPTLVVWGKNDHIFPDDGAYPYRRDLKNMEFHLLDGGHFVLESHGAFIAEEIRDFLKREVR